MYIERDKINNEIASMELVEYNTSIVRNDMHVDDIEYFEIL